MRPLSFPELTALRRSAGRSALLFLTDRCPVGCAHCSVDARRGGPSIARWPLFTALVAGLAGMPSLTVVGISGGEPFAERRGLVHAAERLTDAGKLIVPYTSGYWGARGPCQDVPAWICAVIRRSSCVVLSTDAYHAARLPDRAVIGAARAIARCGVPVACQVIAEPGQLHAAERLLAAALGAGWRDHAELVPIPLLPAGRAARFTSRRAAGSAPSAAGTAARGAAGALGTCPLARSPVVRYDGRVTACCNETVIMGGGPAHLQRTATGADLPDVLAGLAGDGYLTALSSAGAAMLAALGGYQDAARADGLCQACWRLLDLGASRDPRVAAIAAVAVSAATAAGGPRR